MPLPEAPHDRKSESLALGHHLSCFAALLVFLKAHGAALAHVKPEFLMPIEAYSSWLALSTKSSCNKAHEHAHKHAEGWNDVLLQVGVPSRPFFLVAC